MTLNPKLTDEELFDSIKMMENRHILIIEDIDRLLNKKHENITLSGILNMLDGLFTREGLIVFLTTNNISEIDKLVLRPGRIDKKYKFGYMEKEQAREMYLIFFKDDEDGFNKLWRTFFEHENITCCLFQEILILKKKDVLITKKIINDLKSEVVEKVEMYS